MASNYKTGASLNLTPFEMQLLSRSPLFRGAGESGIGEMLSCLGAEERSYEKEEMIQKLVSNMPMLRKRLNLSQEELASIAGVSRQTINAVESRRQNMSWNLFVLLILFFMHNENTCDFLPVVKFDIKKLEQYFLNE